MERCSTCKHWEKPDSHFCDLPGIGKCNAVVQAWDATEWTESGEKLWLKQEYAGLLAFVEDGSSYYAELKTLPDFGCVQHEAR